MENLLYGLNSVGPVFLLVVLGVVLRAVKLVDETLVSRISTLVFTIAVPALVFTKISRTRFEEVFDGRLVLLAVLGAIVFFCLFWALSYLLVKEPRKRGPFIQGTVRGNNAIVSLAIVLNVYGESGASKAAVLLAFLMPLYNILSVIALTVPMHRSGGGTWGRLVKRIVTNPIILAILAALPFSYFSVRLPVVVDRSLGYLSQLTLPLALLNIGASLRLSAVTKPMPAVPASFVKVVLYPAAMTAVAVAVGMRGETLGVLFIFVAAPTAVVSFIMARAMSNDAELAANIIALTTLCSVFTVGAGLVVLKGLQLI